MKKMMSWLLALTMVVSMLPLAASAATLNRLLPVYEGATTITVRLTGGIFNEMAAKEPSNWTVTNDDVAVSITSVAISNNPMASCGDATLTVAADSFEEGDTLTVTVAAAAVNGGDSGTTNLDVIRKEAPTGITVVDPTDAQKQAGQSLVEGTTTGVEYTTVTTGTTDLTGATWTAVPTDKVINATTAQDVYFRYADCGNATPTDALTGKGNNYVTVTADGDGGSKALTLTLSAGTWSGNYTGLEVEGLNIDGTPTANDKVLTVETTGALNYDEDYTITVPAAAITLPAHITGTTINGNSGNTVTLSIPQIGYKPVFTITHNDKPLVNGVLTYIDTRVIAAATTGVTFNATLEDYEKLGTITVEAGKGTAAITDAEDGEFTYDAPGTSVSSVVDVAVAVNTVPNVKALTAADFELGNLTKDYDGTTDGDAVTLTIKNTSLYTEKTNVTVTATCTYAQAGVGTGLTVTATDLTLSGDDAAYYTVDDTVEVTDATGAITRLADGVPTVTTTQIDRADKAVAAKWLEAFQNAPITVSNGTVTDHRTDLVLSDAVEIYQVFVDNAVVQAGFAQDSVLRDSIGQPDYDAITDGTEITLTFANDARSFDDQKAAFDNIALADDYTVTATVKVPNAVTTPTTYGSSLASCENGSATLNSRKTELNKVVTVTATPDEGYEVADVVVAYASGKLVAVTDNGNGTYSYKQPGASVTVTVTFTAIEVEEEVWFEEAKTWAEEKAIVTEDFVQDDICTRADAVTFIWKAMGCPEATGENPFVDMGEGDAYYTAALWAYEAGITTGTEDGTTFSGDWECTRSQIVTLLWRNAGMSSAEIDNAFDDVTEGAWDYAAIQWAVEMAITEGTGNNLFSGLNDCTQMEIVTFLFRQVAA